MLTLPPLPVGVHTVSVSAVTCYGHTGTASSVAFSVVSTIVPPPVVIRSAPNSTTTLTYAVFVVGAASPVFVDTGFEYALDADATRVPAEWTPCTSTLSLSALPRGTHTISFRCVAAGGTPSAAPTSYTWTILSGLGASAFVVDAARAGPQAVYARAMSASGVPSASPPAEFTWVYDPVPPVLKVIVVGPNTTHVTSGVAKLVSTKPGTAFEYKLIAPGGAMGSVLSAVCAAAAANVTVTVLLTLGDGTYGLWLQATDPAGNSITATFPAVWVLDTVLPVVTVSSPSPASDSVAA